MRIVATADLHGDLPEIPECDVLIVAGDVAPDFQTTGKQQDWIENNFGPWLEDAPAEHILGIAGNHDFALELDFGFASGLPWHYMLDEGIEIDHVSFWGSPWVPNLSRWAFHLLDHEIDEAYAQVPENTNIVITHGPPAFLCDFTVPKFGSVHAGFPGTNDMLDRVHPDLLICGHIHEGYGFAHRESAGTTIMNVAHMTENYEPINPPTVIERLDDGSWDWTLPRWEKPIQKRQEPTQWPGG